jgi:hypothetical protein
MTLAFSWATLANYGTGPDVGTPTKVDPASATNGFIAGTVIAPQHVNFLFDAVGDQIIKAIDGIGGGTYTLGSALRFQGADVEINAGLEILAAGEINVQSGGLVQVLSGGSLNVASGGQINLNNGSLLTVVSGAVVDVISGGTVEFNASGDLKIDDALENFRLTLTPQAIALNAGVPTWQPVSPPCAGFVQTNVSGQFQASFAINLPTGDDILSVTVAIDGAVGVGHGATVPAGADRLNISLVRVDGGGVVTTIAAIADAAPAGVGAGGYDTVHSVVLQNGAAGMTGTMPHTVLSGQAYYILVAGETGGDAVANTTAITAVFGTAVARSYRASTMVY